MSQGGTTLTWMDRHGVETPLPGQVTRAWGTGTLSPDGRRVANSIAGDNGSDIWVVDLARGTPTRLTFGGTNDNPIWTRDGRSHRLRRKQRREGRYSTRCRQTAAVRRS